MKQNEWLRTTGTLLSSKTYHTLLSSTTVLITSLYYINMLKNDKILNEQTVDKNVASFVNASSNLELKSKHFIL
jgi:hypothetical protein